MYSRIELAKKYIRYYITACNGNGHGIHSPFVFDFVTKVLKNKKKIERTGEIEKLRSILLQNNQAIEVEDFGAGSGIIKTNRRIIKQIAASSLKQKKYAALFARITEYYKLQIIVELGTSFGISTAYLACVNPASTVYTFEGAENISAIAQSNFDMLALKNVSLIKGDFESTFPALLTKISKIDFAFVDGNHKMSSTINYLNLLLTRSTSESVFIFDDIHWSAEMEEAWKLIRQHPAVTLTIDLFFAGIVFLRNDFKAKLHFVIRF